MPILGVNIEKITASKDSPVKGKIEIKHNVKITDLQEAKLEISQDKQALRFFFDYQVDYEPKIGIISLSGDVLYVDETKKVKDMLAEWKKGKKIGQELATHVINTILTKCTIKALSLSQEVNLPPHLPLPKASTKTNTKNYIG